MGEPISVLHVEDDGDVATPLADELHQVATDITIDHVETPAAALDRLETEDVDCVLSEYDFPGQDGLEFLETVRGEHGSLPFVLFSETHSSALAERAFAAGATDYLPKDTDGATLHRLANRIRDAVHARRGGAASRTVDGLPDGVLDVDETGTIRAANDAARDVLRAGDDLVGRPLGAVVADGAVGDTFLSGYRDAVERLGESAAATVRSEFTIGREDGERFYEVRYAPRPVVGGCVATIRDVTEHREREDELERYETLLETIPDTVVISDVDGNLVDVHGFEGWSGYTREELLGMNVDELVPADYLERARSAGRDLWEDDVREKATLEIEIETKAGECIPFENHLRFISRPDQPEPYVMSVLRNISDRKERERRLNALNETMQRLVQAESSTAMAELVVERACAVLGFDRAGVALQTEDEEGLAYVATVGDSGGLFDDDALVNGLPSAAVESGDQKRRAADDDADPGTELAFPLGEYGVLHLATTDHDGVRDSTVSLAEMLAGHVEAALDRVFYREELDELAERERELDLYEQAVEATGDGIAIMNEEAEFLMVNSWFAESVGQTKAELEGTAVDAEETDAIVEAPDDLAERWLEAGEEARETGRSTFLYESVIDIPRGIRTIENRVTAVEQDDGEVIYVVSSRNITDRKEREEQIRNLHESSRKLMAADTEDAVAAEVVAAVESTLGFPANLVRLVDDTGESLEIAAVTDSAREMIGEAYPSSIPIEGNAVGETFRNGDQIVLDDVREHTDLFDETGVRSVLTLPIGDYGQLAVFDEEVGAYDESDLRIAEILTANAEAAFDRVEKEAALRARERALSRQIDRLDQFANIVSHDLRNPLNVAMGRLTLIEEQIEDTEHVESVEDALDRMASIIDDVLTLAREGDEATDLEPIALRQTAETAWDTVDTATATLSVEADARVMADKSRLQQLLENLIRNGIDHVGEDVTITIGDLEDGFYVEDDGPGIPEADRETVFETGYSTTESGTGFGLNIVDTIARAHDWSVSLGEGSDGGARFEFVGVELADVEVVDA